MPCFETVPHVLKIFSESRRKTVSTKNGVPHGLHLDFLTFCKISEISGVFETIFRHQCTAVYGFLTYSKHNFEKTYHFR